VKIRFVLCISLLFLLVAGSAAAQSTGYRVSGLTLNRPGASHGEGIRPGERGQHVAASNDPGRIYREHPRRTG